MKVTELLKKVRELAARMPDFVYSSGDKYGRTCYYHKGGCDTYPDAVGCIFGQAFRELGKEVPVYQDNINNILESRNYEGSYAELLWCFKVQKNQDNKNTWSKSIEMADAEVKL